ncbi:hypothetical protein JTB14_036030 [Gonioctena quinquepunctata]|nr:hypothetical protein JTB14_036030 [Gonioctena quinquepunctata]
MKRLGERSILQVRNSITKERVLSEDMSSRRTAKPFLRSAIVLHRGVELLNAIVSVVRELGKQDGPTHASEAVRHRHHLMLNEHTSCGIYAGTGTP